MSTIDITLLIPSVRSREVELMFYFELFQDVDDVDKENLHDVAQASLYANDIFKYYKEREVYYNVTSYIKQIRAGLLHGYI